MSRIVLACLFVALTACNETRSSPPRSVPPREPVVETPPAHAAEVLPDAIEVRFRTEDDVEIVGTLQVAASTISPAVILVHQLGSDRAEWAPLLERLHAERAVTTLAIDLRGHGASTTGSTGPIAYGAFDDAAWARTALDVRAAVAYLHGEDSGLHPAHIAAVGASIGATAVIAAAAVEPRIEHIVALSPGRAYHGFDGITPAIGLGDRTFLGIVAREEEDNVETAEALGRVMHAPPLVIDGAAHGVALFAADPTALDRVEVFLRTALESPRWEE